MGAQLKIDSDEAYGLAAELASLREEIEYQELREIVDDIHRHLRHPLPGSDHSWLYDDDDETGLPR